MNILYILFEILIKLHSILFPLLQSEIIMQQEVEKPSRGPQSQFEQGKLISYKMVISC